MSNNPVLLVTGGASGIGKAIASLFATRGYAVVVADIDLPRGRSTVEELCSLGYHAVYEGVDIRNEGSVRNLFERVGNQFPGIDCLCNNAGIERYRPADEYTLADFDAITETNLRGPFLCTRQALPLLKAAKGAIVNVASIQGLATERNISVYAGTKAGILGWSRGVALDFAQFGIRVNTVCPGAIQTPMMDAALVNDPEPQKTLAELATRIPLQRIGDPADIAEVVYFLASSGAAYVTGTHIVVDGGLLARHAL